MVCCLLGAGRLSGQGIGIDRVEIGPVAVHDHVAFDFHIRVKGDPYPHEFKQGYGFDGVDAVASVYWHWGRAPLLTSVRVTPVSRSHFAYDQDSDTKPNTISTHGNAGLARSRSFELDQVLPVGESWFWRHVTYHFGLLRQWTRYHQVTTYDLNTNPALPSNTYTRLISERAIIYNLSASIAVGGERQVGGWRAAANLDLTPMSAVFLRNYIPVVLAATSTEAFGASVVVALSHPVGSWDIQLLGSAGRYRGYHAREGFRREVYTAGVEIVPPWGR